MPENPTTAFLKLHDRRKQTQRKGRAVTNSHRDARYSIYVTLRFSEWDHPKARLISKELRGGAANILRDHCVDVDFRTLADIRIADDIVEFAYDVKPIKGRFKQALFEESFAKRSAFPFMAVRIVEERATAPEKPQDEPEKQGD